jgi:hypothetical protein
MMMMMMIIIILLIIIISNKYSAYGRGQWADLRYCPCICLRGRSEILRNVTSTMQAWQSLRGDCGHCVLCTAASQGAPCRNAMQKVMKVCLRTQMLRRNNCGTFLRILNEGHATPFRRAYIKEMAVHFLIV